MASKHLVICVRCGKQFDANRGGYYNRNSRRYTCKSCGRSQKSEIRKQKAAIRKQKAAIKKQKAINRKERTGMKQSMGAMIAKIAIGVLFVLTGFSSPDGGWTIGYFLTAIVIGGALIAWGLLPYLKARKEKSANSTDEKEPQAQHAGTTKTCASCGAMGTGDFCEYCGKKLSE